MNIFVLSYNPAKAARYHTNSHVCAMVRESAQMLSTAVREHEVELEGLYKRTHANHPCTIWARASRESFLWLCELGLELAKEYTFRYGREHASQAVIELAKQYAHLMPDVPRPPFAKAMPDQYKQRCPVASYRAFYLGEKQHLLTWKNRPVPTWVKQGGYIEVRNREFKGAKKSSDYQSTAGRLRSTLVYPMSSL